MNTDPNACQKILVVDDNEIVIKTISLEIAGGRLSGVTAMDGAEAVAGAQGKRRI
jgi:CheY-like chemotaxis protein